MIIEIKMVTICPRSLLRDLTKMQASNYPPVLKPYIIEFTCYDMAINDSIPILLHLHKNFENLGPTISFLKKLFYYIMHVKSQC